MCVILTSPASGFATQTPPVKKKGEQKGRQGAKMVKKDKVPRLEGVDLEHKENNYIYNPISLRKFRARCRTGSGFGNKELCREFSVPNKNS